MSIYISESLLSSLHDHVVKSSLPTSHIPSPVPSRISITCCISKAVVLAAGIV